MSEYLYWPTFVVNCQNTTVNVIINHLLITSWVFFLYGKMMVQFGHIINDADDTDVCLVWSYR